MKILYGLAIVTYAAMALGCIVITVLNKQHWDRLPIEGKAVAAFGYFHMLLSVLIGIGTIGYYVGDFLLSNAQNIDL